VSVRLFGLGASPAWSVPSSVNYRNVVNCASINPTLGEISLYVRFRLSRGPLKVALDAGDDA
jgi:hypothetical protein